MTLCFIAPFAYRLWYPHETSAPFFGGAEVQQYQLAKALARDTHFSVHCIIGNPRRALISSPAEIREGVLVHQVFWLGRRIPGIDTLLDFLKLYWVLAYMRFDVLIIRGGGVLAGKAAFITKIMLGKKFIFSSMHDRESNALYWQSASLYKRALFAYAVRHADRIICQHTAQQRAFKEYFGRAAVVMPTLYPIYSESEIVKLKAREYVLWVGRLEEWKRPELFIQLAHCYPEEKFVLVTPSDTARIQVACAAAPNIKIIGPVPFDAMDDYFRRAKVFINTSRVEGFPNSFVQAAKNGTPILSLTVNPDGMLQKYAMGRCAEGDMRRLTDDLATVLYDEAVWQEMARNAYWYAAEHHDIMPIVNDYKHVLLSLCD